MKSRGKFKFKEITYKNSGSFTNSQGQVINYSDSYALKVDEISEKGIEERIFKLPVDSPLINSLKEYTAYSDIILDFDVVFYGNSVRVIPTDIIKNNSSIINIFERSRLLCWKQLLQQKCFKAF